MSLVNSNAVVESSSGQSVASSIVKITSLDIAPVDSNVQTLRIVFRFFKDEATFLNNRRLRMRIDGLGDGMYEIEVPYNYSVDGSDLMLFAYNAVKAYLLSIFTGWVPGDVTVNTPIT